MSNPYLRNITNRLQDVRLVSLSSWRQANEITPRDRNGPYIVTQEGYDPDDMKLIPDEFVLGRTGQWLSLSYFFGMPVAERRAEFVFGTAAEVMKTLQDLPSKVAVLRPAGEKPAPSEPDPTDEMATAFQAARSGEGPK